MKYSHYIGIAAALLLIACCFLPWVYIQSIQAEISGFKTAPTTYGSPGAMHVLLAATAIILFLPRKVWSARANVFVVAFNFAWAIRNFLLVTHCEYGECPEKKPGIYAVVLLSAILLVMGLLPKMAVKN